MNKFKKITNLELLKKLELRLPNFAEDEFIILTRLFGKYQPEFMKSIQTISPQAHQRVQEKISEHENEETDKEVEKLKKSLEKEK